MSRKTKSEIELEKEVLSLKHQLVLKDSYIETLKYLLDSEERDRKAISNAHTSTIRDLVSTHDRAATFSNEVFALNEQNKSRGGKSWQLCKPVYKLAERYFCMKRRHEPKYLPGQAATKVHAHCTENKKRFDHVPTQVSIKNNIKKICITGSQS